MIILIATEQEFSLIPPEALNGGVVIVTGIGISNVIRTLSKRHIGKKEPILNVGYAGSPDLPIGTKCLIGKVRQHAENAEFEMPSWDLGGDVPCYTDTDFVTESRLSGCVFDMELAAVCAMGYKNVRAIKVVSDNLNLHQYESQSKGGAE